MRHHTLCFECFRAERDRRRARLLAEVEPARPLRSPFGHIADVRPLSGVDVQHRRRMLAHLQSQAR